ncbi:MAG: ROK family protein [Candidatus Bipolaricaulota bacterium]
MHDLNTRAVTSLLYNNGAQSRTEIASNTNLTRPTISNITSKLLSAGLIEEVGVGESTGGRKPTLLDINEEFGYVMAVKIEARKVITGLYDLKTNKVTGKITDHPANPAPELVLRHVRRDYEDYADREGVVGLGIGVSGLISDSGEIIYSPILDWKRVPIAEKLESQLSLPATVDNDVNSLTLAESWVGAGKEFSDLLCVTVGEGIGAGLIINDRLYRGSAGGAGEIGHITLDRQGPRCRCGEEGCLEALASDYFLQNEMQRRGLVPSTVENLASLASRGQAEGLEIFREMGHNLGLGIKNLVNTLNPEAVVLGGERMEQSEFFLQEAKEEILNHSFPREAKDLEIVRASLGKEGWLIGAALLSIRNFLGLPLHRRAFESNRESRGALQTGTQ